MKLFRDDNTDGYTQAEISTLNNEFWQIWFTGGFDTLDFDDARKAFTHEVAQR